jgi:hypothetical protein
LRNILPSHFNAVADVWATEKSAAIYRRLAKEVEAAIESAATWLYIASVKLIAPSGSGIIDARESFPKQNQGSGIAETIRVRL